MSARDAIETLRGMENVVFVEDLPTRERGPEVIDRIERALVIFPTAPPDNAPFSRATTPMERTTGHSAVGFDCPCGHAWSFETALDAVLTLRGSSVECPRCERKQRVLARDVKALRRAAVTGIRSES